MSYTAICEALKDHDERIAANSCVAGQAKDVYGDSFSTVFKYRKGGKHLVRNKELSIARHYRSLQLYTYRTDELAFVMSGHAIASELLRPVVSYIA